MSPIAPYIFSVGYKELCEKEKVCLAPRFSLQQNFTYVSLSCSELFSYSLKPEPNYLTSDKMTCPQVLCLGSAPNQTNKYEY